MTAAADPAGDSSKGHRIRNGRHSRVSLPSDFLAFVVTGVLRTPALHSSQSSSRSSQSQRGAHHRPCVRWPLWCLLVQGFQCIDAVPPCNASDEATVSSEVDAGGDGCDYYLLYPQFCGCCDTVNFSASDCCACQPDKSDPGGHESVNWTETFYTWPSKATSLVLPKAGLEGEIPRDCADRWPNLVRIDLSDNSLQGDLPPQLGRLSKLTSLSLGGNRFTGGMPPELGSLSRLRTLRLSWTNLGGTIPAELGRLSSLEGLYLANAGLTGSLPCELGSLARLKWLHLERNGLAGSIPGCLGQLSRLETMLMYANALSGSIPPELGSLHRLKKLVLHTNELTGALPCKLGGLSNLWTLDVRHNRLTGGVHECLCRLSHLRSLLLRNNSFEGSLPLRLGSLRRLRTLDLSANRFSGPVPAKLGELSHLKHLYLYSNFLTGSLPPELGNLSKLIHFILDTNRFTGNLPAELGNLSSLRCLRIFSNQLSGPLPPQLGRLSKMWLFSVTDNAITGEIPPEFGNLSNLMILRLLGNQLTGPVPRELGRLPLISLNAGENQLSDRIPPELGNLTYLRELNLGDNQLQGPIPPSLGGLSRLEILSLYKNQLSGHLPPELGKLSRLGRLWLDVNRLEGDLPAALGNLSLLRQFDVSRNSFRGVLPPELGSLSRLWKLAFAGNQLAGDLPPSFKGLGRLTNLTAGGNPGLCGNVAVLAQLPKLKHVSLRGCCFQSFPGLPQSIEHLDLGENRLTEVPQSWRQGELASLRQLYLDGNNMSEWDTSMVLDRRVFSGNGKAYYCGFRPRGQNRLPWPGLETLDVSANPIGQSTSIRDFLWSLAYLKKLSVLKANRCNLTGDIAREHEPALFVPDLPHSGDSGCRGMPAILPGFPSLVQLELAENRIAEVLSDPPPSIIRADLSQNGLVRLHPHWWLSEVRLKEVNVRGNPDLSLAVNLQPGGTCPPEGATGLTADPSSWRRHENTTSECSHLCMGRHVHLISVDITVNETVMCRCSHGQGNGLQCSDCPRDTYSAGSFHSGRWHRSCLACPSHSQLPEGQATCFTSCQCAAGYYMGVQDNHSLRGASEADCRQPGTLGKCHWCGPFKTSVPGSQKPTDCYCNADAARGGFDGLVEQAGQCGCPTGQSLNFVSRRCEECRASEDCGNFTQSLEPPVVKAGFWALPAPPPGPDGIVVGFSRHSIWRCNNAEVCPGDSSCAGHRHGPACSLCDEGFYGTPGSECKPCSQPFKTGWCVLVGVLLGLSPLPLLAHLLLETDARSRGLMLTLRAFRTSLRQVLKFAQVMGVVSLLSVEWPGPVAHVFQWFRAVSLDFGSLFGVACLDSNQQQTMTLELFFRWLLPFAIAAFTCVAAFTVAIPARRFGAACGCSGPKCLSAMRRVLGLRAWELLRLLSFFLHLFYPSLLKNGLVPLTCSPSPHGKLTMNAFPHVICWSTTGENEESFWLVAVAGLGNSIFFMLVVPALLYFAWKRTALSMIDSNFQKRGRWGFFFEDFRPTMMRWTLVAVFRDICLNLIPVCLPGLGTAQLLLTAGLSTAYGWRVCFDSPYIDSSNTVLEAWSALAVSALCVGTAGLGFQWEPEVLDVSDRLVGGRDNPIYWQRTILLLILQAVAILGPLLVLSYQLLVAFRSTQRFVPKCLLPEDTERQSDWCATFSNSVKSEELNNILQQLDKVEFQTFRSVMMSSVASVAILGQFDDRRRSGLSGLACRMDSERESSRPEDSFPLSPLMSARSGEAAGQPNNHDEAVEDEDGGNAECEAPAVQEDHAAAEEARLEFPVPAGQEESSVPAVPEDIAAAEQVEFSLPAVQEEEMWGPDADLTHVLISL